MKTVAEWFNEIQDPEIAKNARRAIVMQGKNIERGYDRLCDALNYINWSQSTQGQDYWARIHDNIQRGELV